MDRLCYLIGGARRAARAVEHIGYALPIRRWYSPQRAYDLEHCLAGDLGIPAVIIGRMVSTPNSEVAQLSLRGDAEPSWCRNTPIAGVLGFYVRGRCGRQIPGGGNRGRRWRSISSARSSAKAELAGPRAKRKPSYSWPIRSR